MKNEVFRELSDRSIALLLKTPAHMLALLRLTSPELAARLETGSLHALSTKLIAASFDKRDEGVLYEARLDNGERPHIQALGSGSKRRGALATILESWSAPLTPSSSIAKARSVDEARSRVQSRRPHEERDP